MQPYSRELATLGWGGRSGSPPRNVPSGCFANQVTVCVSSLIHHATRAESAVWTELGSMPTELERYPFRRRQPSGWRAGRSAITLAPVAAI